MEYNTTIPFEFRGNGKDYFRIWIVNLFLSVITLGIYSAWAKVRTQRYMYSHTFLDGSCFEYTAEPKQILIGRLIAAVIFGGIYITGQFAPIITPFLFLIAVPLVPWMLYKSMQFRARNSVYRNIRFGFSAPRNEILKTMVGLPVIYVFTLGLGIGFVMQRFYEFVVENSRYGKTYFEFHSTVGDYYMFLLKLLGLTILAVVVLTFGAGAMVAAAASLDLENGGDVIVWGTIAIYLPFYLLIFAFSKAATGNLLYQGFVIPGWYTFQSDLKTWPIFKIYLVNTILIILTVGLYIPFAKIRMMQYRVSVLEFVSTQPLDAFEFEEDPEVSAVGQELGEMFDFGVSL